MHLHDPIQPRHARMFELLRQSQQAATTVERLEVIAAIAPEAQPVRKFQAFAVQSLKSPLSETRIRSAFHR